MVSKVLVCQAVRLISSPGPAPLPREVPVLPELPTVVGPVRPPTPGQSLPPASPSTEVSYPLDPKGYIRDGTLREVFNSAAQRQFRLKLMGINPSVVAQLEQPFGKDNLCQVFVSEAALRHVLLPLWKTGFLAGDVRAWDSLMTAYYPARLLGSLLDDYGDTDPSLIRGYPPGWKDETEVNEERVASATACVLKFDGNIAAAVRWIGGPHVNAHLDVPHVLARLKETVSPPAGLISNVERILTMGIPAKCTASATEVNFEAYYRYGNHTTVDEEPEKTYKAMVKDNKKGYTLLLDSRILLLLLHCHVTPQGVVDLNTPYKNPRPIFDSSFRPNVDSIAINDITHKDNEPPLTFASAELGFMTWVYNLRLTYPDDEVYIADDDISGAFRRMKYNPNVMAMHASVQCGYVVINTGGTFGDNTSPSNWDPLALARRVVGQHIWVRCKSVFDAVAAYIPALAFEDPPPGTRFCPADPDSINCGVLDAAGNRLPPPYHMHVDDNLYADIKRYIIHTITVSVYALFEVFGWPGDGLVPSPLSNDKFDAKYNHLRKLVGRLFNSRDMTVGLLPYKRERLIEMLTEWQSRTTFDILQLAQLLGTLENHTRYTRWARCWFLALQNEARRILLARYAILARRAGSFLLKRRRLLAFLPGPLQHRVDALISRDKAAYLWSTRQRMKTTSDMFTSIGLLHKYLNDESEPWTTPFGMIIPRDPHFNSLGDASHTGGGAYCPKLGFWLEVVWSPAVTRGVSIKDTSDPGFVHINSLEFIVIILQFAAVITRLGTADPDHLRSYFPSGVPDIPVWLGETDNTVSKSWENRGSTGSRHGQSLVSVYAELLRRARIHTQCEHVAGVDNDIADAISRNNFSLPPSARWPQLFLKYPSIGTYDFFLPKPEFLQLLTSSLFSPYKPEVPVLPPVLGHFIPAGSIISGSLYI